ncbi:MAG: chromosome segregation protein SMC [Saprospiraceae bacterium]|nr:chromosome segregation protein SMC [Saprospiraceae bacterium]
MRLKSLQIKGFKSFANDTILNFNEDVIGVVGPNGSGKSNIVDAIRWVLGEQKSKELRLEAMSDVIFNGTKTKKEAATATVALTFENTKGILPIEYHTVTISRTLFRSGESEYRLNNVTCRLKDINTLFLDTGIGSNSYAIIALGMVDDILSDKENARRRMFEQAAGVSKYKIRKRETLNKLKSATEDLDRIDDLLFEIDGNLKSLEKQARRTQKYLDLKAEYKDLSIKHAIFSISYLKQKYKGIDDQLGKEQQLYRENDAILFTKQARLEKDKKTNVDKEIALSDKQKRLNELVYQIRTKEGEKGLLQQKLEFKKLNKDQISKILMDNEAQILYILDEIQALSVRLQSEKMFEEMLNVSLLKSKEIYDATKQEYNSAKLSFDSKQREKQELERQVFDLEKTIAIHKNSVENHEREINRSAESILTKEKDNKQSSDAVENLDKSYHSKENELKLLLESETNRKQRLVELENRKDKLRDDFNKINRNIDSKQNEFDLLKSMVDNFEGFPESIKFLNDHWRKDLVILSDLLDVKEAYKAPVELYLEQYLNYFVVDSIKEAIQGISLLKQSQKGKANFFLLDKLHVSKPKRINDGSLIPAVDLVSVPNKYQDLIDVLLKDCYIFDGDIESFSDTNEQITVISASGTFLKSGFTISGGSVGLFEGKKIGRKQNLDKLASFLSENLNVSQELAKEMDELSDDISKVKSADQIITIEKVKSELQQIDQQRIKLNHDIRSFNELQKETETKIKLSKEQIKDLLTRMSHAEQQLSILRLKINELEKPGSGHDTDVDKLSEKMSTASEQFNNDNIAVIRHQNLIANFLKDKEFKEVKVSELTHKIETDKSRLTSEDRERIDIEDQLIKLDDNLHELYVERKNFQATLGEAEQDYFKVKNEITEIEDQIRLLHKNQTQLQQSIQLLKDQFTEQKFQVQAVSERLRIEFNISINDFVNDEMEQGLEFDQLTEDVEKIKSKMLGYGDVNPLAVEAYNEIKERFDNINIQRKDILDAKESLIETIKEIEGTATIQFMAAFEKVRSSFIDVFRSLFTEDDTCDLILVDPSNPLESDIEIIAKPKGKKPKSLSQLSGGEKTLTATALLFALYLLKPAPFCIFDEVDAPLDDANIQKFNRIIHKFSKESQFIIVTHNKSTMAEVDVLYGVYMDEPGISSVSAVDFRILKHEPIMESLN